MFMFILLFSFFPVVFVNEFLYVKSRETRKDIALKTETKR